MNGDRWKQIEDCYHSAMERPAPERAAFLAQACAADPELRREVESLLAHEGQADELLESPAWDQISPVDETCTISSGTLVAGWMMAEYRIAEKLGAGGMGEVYRAIDTKLHREAALKVLTPEFAQNAAWMSRFQREARVLASLNHPHIAAIYGLEESAGVRAIAMELVEGPTLAERMARGRVPIPEALAISRQIADALEYAHEKGIVHRDLKPANVKLRRDGVVKVLDFGLAKGMQTNDTPQVTATAAGAILGTPAYMAPEQAAGLPVDRRADIWAFGVVLFEMLAGRQIYARKTTLETLAAVARDEPKWDELPAETPTTVVSMLRRCLDKDAKRRLRDIGEARVILEEPERIADAPPARRGHPRISWLVTGVLAAALAALAVVHFRERPAESLLTRYSILPPENTIMGTTAGTAPAGTAVAVSPDGRRLVFSLISSDGQSRLWIRPIDSMESRPLAGTERANTPFWSPDSRQIGFWADGKLKRIDAGGGAPITLCDAFDLRGGTWNREGVIVFAPSHTTALFRVSAAGGSCTPLTKLETTGGVAHRFPWFLPDGRHFLFMVSPAATAPDSVTIWAGSLDSPETKKLLEANSNALYSQGYLLFLRENTLLAQRFDPGRLAIEGEATPIAADVQSAVNAARGRFSVSNNGLLVYQTGVPGMRQLAWFDRTGNRLSNLGEPGRFDSVSFSPDRKSVAVTLTEQRNTDIWLFDVASARRTRFTFDPAVDRQPIWSPDGRTIVFSSNRHSHFDLYRKGSDSIGTEDLLYADDQDKDLWAWSADGKFLLYGTGRRTCYLLPVPAGHADGTLKPLPIAEGCSLSQFSPGGRWIAAQSNESGRSEIYVRPFRGPSATPSGKIQVSAVGFAPRWRSDGKELFFVAPDGTFMSADVKSQGDSAQIGDVRPLARIVLGNGEFYDVSLDGQRFLVAAPLDRPNEPFTVVENWTASLKK